MKQQHEDKKRKEKEILSSRDQLNRHIASACTRAFVTCPFPVCNDVLRREDQARHEADNAPSHLQLLLAERRANQLNEVSNSKRNIWLSQII